MATIWRERRLVWQLSLHHFHQQYAATMIGSLWAVVQPLVTIAVFWFIFSYGFRDISQAGKPPFVLLLISGFVPWMMFADAVNGGTSTIVTHRYLVKKIAFPLEILPVVNFVSAAIVHAALLVVLLVLLLVYGYPPTLYVLQLPVFFFGAACFSIGLTWFLSALNVFQRDIGQSVGVIIMLWFWMTPIVWPMEMLGDGIAARILMLNPMYYVVEGYRASLLYGRSAMGDPLSALSFWGITIAMMVLGRSVFSRLKVHFADVL
jgi:ABC-type polysaccharide/polyol phosphate export permease